jgi:hypothetical protein
MNISKKYYVILAMYTSAVSCAQYSANEELGSTIRRYAARNDITHIDSSQSSLHFEMGEEARAKKGVPHMYSFRDIPNIGNVEVVEIVSPYKNEKQEYDQYFLLKSNGKPIIITQAKDPNQKKEQKDKLAKL